MGSECFQFSERSRAGSSGRAIIQSYGARITDNFFVGYTWFPLFTMIDWRYRFGQRPLEEYKIELGLFKLKSNSSNGRWLSTPLVEQLRGYLADPEKSIRTLAPNK